MRYKLKAKGGGIFSHFMVALLNAVKMKTDDFYLDIAHVPYGNTIVPESGEHVNPFDYVFDQDPTFNSERPCVIETAPHDLFNTKILGDLRSVVSGLKIKSDILKKIDDQIDSDTLGVHFRFTDMQLLHKNDFGIVGMDEYLKKIDDVVKTYGIKKIFVGSDNDECLNFMIRRYAHSDIKIIYNSVNNRCPRIVDPNGDYNKYLRENFLSESLWTDSMLEMLSLSKCGYLIYRVSNVANIAMAFSKSLKSVFRLIGTDTIDNPINTNTYKIDGCFVDDDRRFAFVHIYKNASISMRNVLNMRGKYFKYADIKDLDIVKICVIRNPIDRCISMFLYLLRLEDNGRFEQHPTYLTRNSTFYANRGDIRKSFSQFINIIEAGNFYDAVTAPQVNFLNDRGLNIEDVDFVFVQERISDDFEKFKIKYGLPVDLTFPKDNDSSSEQVQILKEYVRYNSYLKSRILEIYADDWDMYQKFL